MQCTNAQHAGPAIALLASFQSSLPAVAHAAPTVAPCLPRHAPQHYNSTCTAHIHMMCHKLTFLLSVRSRYAMRVILELFATLFVRMPNGLTRACVTTTTTCILTRDLLLPGGIAHPRYGRERPWKRLKLHANRNSRNLANLAISQCTQSHAMHAVSQRTHRYAENSSAPVNATARREVHGAPKKNFCAYSLSRPIASRTPPLGGVRHGSSRPRRWGRPVCQEDSTLDSLTQCGPCHTRADFQKSIIQKKYDRERRSREIPSHATSQRTRSQALLRRLR